MTPSQQKKLQEAKQYAFISAIEEIEGKVISSFEAKEFGYIEQRPERPNEEFVIWRLKPILHFKWSGKTGELKTLKLYAQ